MSLIVKVLCLSFNSETSGKSAASGQTFVNGVHHDLPYLGEIFLYFLSLMLENIVGKTDVAIETVFGYFVKGGMLVKLLGGVFGTTLNNNITATYRHYSCTGGFVSVTVICEKIECVLVRKL